VVEKAGMDLMEPTSASCPNMLVAVPPRFLDNVWPVAWHYIAKVYAKGRAWVPQEELLNELKEGRSLLWVFSQDTTITGVFTSRILVRGPLRVLRVENLATDTLKEMMQEFDHFTELCTQIDNVDILEVETREGFKGLLQEHGFKTDTIVGRKVLGKMQ